MKQYYYTVTKNLQSVENDIEETTGWKEICLYRVNNKYEIETISSFTILNKENTEEQIVEKLIELKLFGGDIKFKEL